MLMPTIDRYLALRRALGSKLVTAEWLLRSFARFATAQGDRYIVSHTAITWAQQTTTAHQCHRRLKVITMLARFLHAEDPRHEIPPEDVFCSAYSRPLPYIFTEEELQRLIQHARQLGPVGSLRPHMYSTLFGLLAVSGLRISEALSLRLGDVTNDGLIVRETKFHKSRLVPLHESTTAALGRYLELRQCVESDDDHLFVSVRRTKLSHSSVHQVFRQLSVAAGIPRQPGTQQVRLHDFRHTVAVRALQACPCTREQVTPHMLALTTYLGHGSVRSTFWYLQSTPQLMRDIAEASETWMQGDNQ